MMVTLLRILQMLSLIHLLDFIVLVYRRSSQRPHRQGWNHTWFILCNVDTTYDRVSILHRAAVHFTVETIRAATALFYEDRPTDKTELRAMRAKRRVKTQAGVPADLPQAPKSISKALWQFNRAEAQKWLESILKEWNGLDDLGVFEHGFT